MAGQGRLDGDFGRFKIPDFANHDNVRILPHQRTHAFGEAQVDDCLHLHLVE